MGHGTALKYSIINFGGNEAATIEFGYNGVSFSSFSSTSSVQRRNSDIIKFLCILAYLDGFYSIALKDLYPNLIEALCSSTAHYNRSDLSNSVSVQQLSSLNSMNLSLSQRLLLLHSENIGLNEKLNSHKSAAKAAIQEARRRFGEEVAKSILAIYTEQAADTAMAIA